MGGPGLDRTEGFQKFYGSGLDWIQFYRIRTGLDLLLAADTYQRDLIPLSRDPFKIESDSAAADFAAHSTVQQGNPRHNEPVVLAHQKGFAPS